MGYTKGEGGMGFRNLNDFNLALLAKQCWRLIHEPDALLVKVLKARYFPHVSFFEARNGGRASWIWSSLLEGRELLREGAHWQVLNGHQTKLWVDKWLPETTTGHPKEECLVIETTNVGDSESNDKLIWPMEKKGNYSVKSGYRWIRRKAKAVLQGCLSAKQSNYPCIIVEFDSKQICKWSWVPRSTNEVANFVATYVGTEMTEECRIDKPPSSLVRILNKDGLPCPPLYMAYWSRE
ncbi:hypothetical protein ACFX13_013659 [Malus domestica]